MDILAESQEITTLHVSNLSRSVPFLRHWPLERLRGNAQACTVYYFDRNQVLVRDSNNSDWIYVVLKGSLSVIKKLKRVDPKTESITPRKKPRVSLREPKQRHYGNRARNIHLRTSHPHRHSSDNFTVDSNNNNLSPLPHELCVSFDETFKSPFELESKLEQTLPGYHNSQDRLGILDYDKIIGNFRSRLNYKGTHKGSRAIPDSEVVSSVNRDLNVTTNRNGHVGQTSDSGTSSINSTQGRKSSFLPDIANNNKVIQTQCNPVSTQNGAKFHHTDDLSDEEADDEQGSQCSEDNVESRRQRRKRKRISKTAKGVYLAPSRQRKVSQETEESSPEAQALTSPEPAPSDDVSTVKSVEQEDQEESISEKLAKLQIQYQRRVIDREGRKTIAEELDHKARRDYKFTEADLDPTIIELQVLERGQYFGVKPLLFQDQPSLSVISNGAECLVMSKKLFLLWASEDCLRHLRQTESPYPTEQELKRKLQDMVNWQAARALIYQQMETEIRLKKSRRKQFLPAYQGQYCFRTGPT